MKTTNYSSSGRKKVYLENRDKFEGSGEATIREFSLAFGATEALVMDVITKLEATRDRTLQCFDLGNDELARCYAPGKWSVRFILHHLADGETVLNDRIRRTISEPRQVLWAFNQDAWATGLDYSQMPLDLSRQIYEATRAGIIHLAHQHYDTSGQLEFVHSETGVRTLRDEFDKVAAHNAHHLDQIELALKRK